MLSERRRDGGLAINERIADQFDEMADLLQARHANDFRIRAYRRGAEVLRELLSPVVAILADSGRQGLEEIPGIGKSLAYAIDRFVDKGRIPLLQQFREADSPERRFSSVPGGGPKLASRIRNQLHVDTPGELEAAAIDGSLPRSAPTTRSEWQTERSSRQDVPGVGPQRPQAVRDSIARRTNVANRLQRTHRDASHHDEPTVAELLSIDAEYREKVAADKLMRIAPRRFNPTGEAWLPILNTHRESRHYRAMYSNTAHAHELGMTHDWLIIHRTDREHHGQWTVITSLLGALQGRRIVRGREEECLAFYRQHPSRVAPGERFIPDNEPRQLLLFDPTTQE